MYNRCLVRKAENILEQLINVSFGDTYGRDVDYKHEFKNERRMKNENDFRVEEFHKLENGQFVVKNKMDEG